MIKPFKTFLKEALTSGTDLEYSIEQSWKEQKPIAYKAISSEAANNILKYLQSSKIGAEPGQASQIGAENFSLSKDWVKFGGKNGTPKTDVILGEGDKIARLSVKMGDAQLMSGGPGESIATFGCVAEKMGVINDSELEKLLNKIPETFTRGRVEGKVDPALKAGDEVLTMFNQKNKEMKSMLEEYFNTNEEFQEEFIIECMSGAMKFGGIGATLDTDKSAPIAQYVFCSSMEGEQPKLYEIDNKIFVRKVIEATNLYVRFKSTSVKSKGKKTGEYDYWTVMSMTTNAKKLEKELAKAEITSDAETQEQLNNSIISYYDGDILVEGIFSELADKVKNAWEQIKNIWNNILNWIKKSIQNLLEFFEFELDIHMNNTIDWSTL